MAVVTATGSLATAPPAPPARPRVLLIGSALVSGATFLFFTSLLAIYLARRADVINAGGRWLPRDAKIPLTQPTMMLMTLLMSLVTVLWAADALRKEDKANAYVALGVTLVFGFAYVNQGTYLLSRMGLSTKSEAGLLILTIGGAHIALVLLAMGFLVLVTFRTLSGQYRRIPEGINAAAVFWFATVAVWAVLWYGIFVTK